MVSFFFTLVHASAGLAVLSSLALTAANAQELVIAIRGDDASPLIDATSDDQADWKGLEWDVIQHLCDPVSGYLRNCSYIKANTRDEKFELLANNTADVVIAGVGASEERCNDLFQCIHPFYWDYSCYLYSTPEIAETINSYGDIEGKAVCQWEESILVPPLKALGASIYNTELYSEAVEEINDGNCIALAGCPTWAFIPEGLVRVDLPPYFERPGTILVSRDADPALVSSLQAGVSSLYQSGTESLILKFEDTHIVSPGIAPADEDVATQVDAISKFNSSNGREGSVGLPASFGEEFAGINGSDTFNITIATWAGNLPPLYNPEGGNGSYGGIEGALIKNICARERINCESFVDVESLNDRFTVLDEGRANITVGAITVDPSRLEKYPFVTPFYYSTGMGLFTSDDKKPQYEDIDSLEALNGLKVCSEVGAVWQQVVKDSGATVIEVASEIAAEAAVKNGDCELFAYDSAYAIPGLSMLSFVEPSTTSPYGIAMGPDSSPALYSELVAAMITIIEERQLSQVVEQATSEAGAVAPPQVKNVTSIISTGASSMGDSPMPDPPAPSPAPAGALGSGAGIALALMSMFLIHQ